MITNYSSRQGASFTEVCIVIGIVGILASLLIPAVQSARESARSLSCRSKLKQLGSAVASFESHFSRYPPGYVGALKGGIDEERCTWIGSHVYLLPYIERGKTFETINTVRNLDVDALQDDRPLVRSWWLDRLQDSVDCQQIAEANLSEFVCPSDPGVGDAAFVLVAVHSLMSGPHSMVIGRKEIELSSNKVGQCSFVGASGFAGAGLGSQLSRLKGVLYNRSKSKHRDIADGTVHTILYGEVTGGWSQGVGGNNPPKRISVFPWISSGAIPVASGLSGTPQFDRFNSYHSSKVINMVSVGGNVFSLNPQTIPEVLFALTSAANGETVAIE